MKNYLSIQKTVIIQDYLNLMSLIHHKLKNNQKEKILKSIEELEAEGDTPGESAIRVAYQVAKSKFIKPKPTTVIKCS